VLDTGFSSALWPFSTLGWPESTPELSRYYPTATLITGFDILFFWVARMIMTGLRFMRDVPFRRVYITGLVRDAERQKMSKTRGNVVDPLDLIDRYGADSLRFTMAAMAVPGSDLPLSEERMAGYRAFANKLWNASRFVLMNADAAESEPSAPDLRERSRLSPADRWILSRLARLSVAVEISLGQFRFDEMANALYRFLWHEYCDWYLEMAKPRLGKDGTPADARSARIVLQSVLEQVLRLLHPVMPFLTEEIWQRLPHRGETIATAPYPEIDSRWIDEDVEREMTLLMEVVTRVRNLRAELSIDPGQRIRLLYHPHTDAAREALNGKAVVLMTLARLSQAIEVDATNDCGAAARAVAAGVDLAVPLDGVLDVTAERQRLERSIARLQQDRAGHARKLQNPEFLSRARPEVVEKTRAIDVELREKVERLTSTLESLG
jgi:valyl-tRNA synthetase